MAKLPRRIILPEALIVEKYDDPFDPGLVFLILRGLNTNGFILKRLTFVAFDRFLSLPRGQALVEIEQPLLHCGLVHFTTPHD